MTFLYGVMLELKLMPEHAYFIKKMANGMVDSMNGSVPAEPQETGQILKANIKAGIGMIFQMEQMEHL